MRTTADGRPVSLATTMELDVHQLDSFERFDPLTWTPPFPSFAWRDEPLSFVLRHLLRRFKFASLAVSFTGTTYFVKDRFRDV
jgi:hypothetical protein